MPTLPKQSQGYPTQKLHCQAPHHTLQDHILPIETIIFDDETTHDTVNPYQFPAPSIATTSISKSWRELPSPFRLAHCWLDGTGN